MAETMVTFTDENFAEAALRNPLPVIVDFWAEWCGPCRMLTPIIDEIAKEMSGSIIVGKLNVDECPKTAARYGVSSIPTLLFIKGGEVVEQHTGLLGKKPLSDKIRKTFGA
jgi:thioredoxin 1